MLLLQLLLVGCCCCLLLFLLPKIQQLLLFLLVLLLLPLALAAARRVGVPAQWWRPRAGRLGSCANTSWLLYLQAGTCSRQLAYAAGSWRMQRQLPGVRLHQGLPAV